MSAPVLTIRKAVEPITQSDLIHERLLAVTMWKAKRELKKRRADLLQRLEQGAKVEEGCHTVRIERRRRAGCAREQVVVVVE